MSVKNCLFKTTDYDYLFQRDFITENIGKEITNEIKNKLWNDIREIMRKVSKIIISGSNKVKLYNNF
jgi:hypothetical protein